MTDNKRDNSKLNHLDRLSKKEMELTKEKIKQCETQEEKDKLMKELASISQRFHFYMEYNKQFKH